MWVQRCRVNRGITAREAAGRGPADLDAALEFLERSFRVWNGDVAYAHLCCGQGPWQLVVQLRQQLHPVSTLP